MSDSQLQCKYLSHNDEEIIALCVNSNCKQPRLCCFTCMKDGHHQQHDNDILKLQQFNQWKQDGVKIIDSIKLVISEQANMTQLLKQLVIDNQKVVALNIVYATDTELEQQINQINKLKFIDQIIQNDLLQVSQLIKKKLKELKQQIGIVNQKNQMEKEIYIFQFLAMRNETIFSRIRPLTVDVTEIGKQVLVLEVIAGQTCRFGLLMVVDASFFQFTYNTIQKEQIALFIDEHTRTQLGNLIIAIEKIWLLSESLLKQHRK